MHPETELSSLHRGLQALELLAMNGATTISALARALGLPRANVYRIIRTLESCGYCVRIPDSSYYIATTRLAATAATISEADRLVNASLAAFAKARRVLQWPIGIVVPRDLDMLICLATDRDNSLAISKFSPGRTTPMLKTTSGVLTLAYMPDAEREQCLTRLQAAGQIERFFFGDFAMLRRVLDKALVNGYVLNDSRYTEGSISVPIHVHSTMIGAMMIKYIRSAVSRETVLTEFLPILRATAQTISERMATMPGPNAVNLLRGSNETVRCAL